jgi:hypothetical protein
MTDFRMFESYGSFVVDYIRAAIDGLANLDSKEASFCLDQAERLIRKMRDELGFVGA